MARLAHTDQPTASTETASDAAPLLTVPELASWLRISQKTIYAWAAAGRLPCVRLGGRLRFSRGDVLRWLEARKEA